VDTHAVRSPKRHCYAVRVKQKKTKRKETKRQPRLISRDDAINAYEKREFEEWK
jgi:hypothetical protein